MAHNLEIIDGKASFMNAGTNKPAWHGLGVNLENLATAEEAIKYARLDYQVEKIASEYQFNGQHIIDPTKFHTVRTDNGASLGIVGRQYNVIQNTELFTFFDDLVDRGEAIYETAGVLGKGEKVWIMARLPQDIVIAGYDKITPYLLLTGSHDGSSSVTAKPCFTRVVCNNTLDIAMKEFTKAVKIPHTKNASIALKSASQALGLAVKMSDQLEGIFNKMAATKISIEKTKEYLDLLIPRKSEVSYKTATDVAKEEIMEIIQNGVGQEYDTCKNTVFGVFNGVTHYLDHNKEYTSEDRKLFSIWYGYSAIARQKAFDLCLELVK